MSEFVFDPNARYGQNMTIEPGLANSEDMLFEMHKILRDLAYCVVPVGYRRKVRIRTIKNKSGKPVGMIWRYYGDYHGGK